MTLADGVDVEIRPLERQRPRGARGGRRSPVATKPLPALRLPQAASEQARGSTPSPSSTATAATPLVATDPMTGDIVGVGRFAALPDKEGAVDVAVTVGDPWQGRGFGTALLVRLIERARDERHLAVHATMLAENTASIAMLRRVGFASRSGAGAMREFELGFTEPRGRENP